MTNLLKSRDITLQAKVHIVKALIFPVVMYRCESWTIKKAGCQRTDTFEVFKKSLESPLDSKEIKPVNPKGNQSWIFIGRTDAEAETPILCPIWFKELTHWKRSWCWERLRARGKGGNRVWHGRKAPSTQWTWIWANSRRWWRTRKPSVLQSMGLQRVGHDWGTEQQ